MSPARLPSYVRVAVVSAACLAAGTLVSSAAQASGLILVEAESVSVTDAWARASAGAATTGAAYMTLTGGARVDQLVAVSTPVAATAEVHETVNDNGIMKMRPVPVVPLPPSQKVTFAPGSYHVMMTGLKQRLVAGHTFTLTLTFAHAAPVTVDVMIRGMSGGTMGSMNGHDGMH